MSRSHYGSMHNPHSACGKLWRIFTDEFLVGFPVPAPYLQGRVGTTSIATVASHLRGQLAENKIGYDIKNELEVEYELICGEKVRKVKSFYRFVPVQR